jgi:hypothetical protein
MVEYHYTSTVSRCGNCGLNFYGPTTAQCVRCKRIGGHIQIRSKTYDKAPLIGFQATAAFGDVPEPTQRKEPFKVTASWGL